MDIYSARKKKRKERKFSIDPVRPDVRPRPKGLVNYNSLWRQNDPGLA